MKAEVCLASGSQPRLALLEQLGLSCLVRAMDIDESRQTGEPPGEYVVRLAQTKAGAGFASIEGALPTLGADTVIVCREQLLIKPTDSEDACRMLNLLSGCTHHVYTCTGIVMSGAQKHALVVSAVTFAPLTARDIEAYVASGEPLGKAGAYAIQGLGGSLVERIEGSYSNVVGLPLYETRKLLEWAQVPVLGRRNQKQ